MPDLANFQKVPKYHQIAEQTAMVCACIIKLQRITMGNDAIQAITLIPNPPLQNRCELQRFRFKKSVKGMDI